jgi:hypothetical protein
MAIRELVIHHYTLNKFMRQGKEYHNLLGLYMFYLNQARIQGTNSPLATNDFVKRGLGWSIERIKRVKRLLKELDLIEVVRKGQYSYVKLKYVYSERKINEILCEADNPYAKEEESQETEKSENSSDKSDKKRDFESFLKKNHFSDEQIKKTKDMVLAVKDFKKKYQNRVDALALANWFSYCKRRRIAYNQGNVESWIKVLANLFFIEQRDFVKRMIKRGYKNLTYTASKYMNYRGRSVYFKGKVYSNLQNMARGIVDNLIYYFFDNGVISSRLGATKLFITYEYYEYNRDIL